MRFNLCAPCSATPSLVRPRIWFGLSAICPTNTNNDISLSHFLPAIHHNTPRRHGGVFFLVAIYRRQVWPFTAATRDATCACMYAIVGVWSSVNACCAERRHQTSEGYHISLYIRHKYSIYCDVHHAPTVSTHKDAPNQLVNLMLNHFNVNSTNAVKFPRKVCRTRRVRARAREALSMCLVHACWVCRASRSIAHPIRSCKEDERPSLCVCVCVTQTQTENIHRDSIIIPHRRRRRVGRSL